MSAPAVRVEGIAKRYRIGFRRQRSDTLVGQLQRLVSSPLHNLRRLRGLVDPKGEGSDILWALRDVSFEVEQGEVLGIVGHNGAGKSTLLKILSRITPPSAGRAELKGRVSSLLEVGTGFHPELTGRDNVYLNGTILGMRRREIDRKLEEIVEFAGVGRFLDTPVKRYSSGMQVRLAFSVAAHLEPEILLVDEVLAVGDAQFQKKCFEKMHQVGNSGRTILFVSHNMAAVRHICRRGLLLEDGRVADYGPLERVVDTYLARNVSAAVEKPEVTTGDFTVHRVEARGEAGPVIKTFGHFEVLVQLSSRKRVHDPGLYIAILSLDNQRLCGLDFKDFRTVPSFGPEEVVEMGFAVDELPLLPGRYQLEIYVKDMANHEILRVPRTFFFDIVETPVYGGRRIDRWYGMIGLRAEALFRSPTSALPSLPAESELESAGELK